MALAVTGGWYNHYDDPDEFWDDEPLIRPQSLHVANSAQTTHTQWASGAPPSSDGSVDLQLTSSVNREGRLYEPQVGSPFVSMRLDNGFLPVRIEFTNGWSRHVAPREVSEELMRAYHAATSQRLAELYSAGSRPMPQEVSVNAVPDHRTMLTVLLETRTWEQYCEVSSAMMGSRSYTVSSSTVFDGGQPVTVIADRQYLLSCRIWPDWAARVHPDQIGEEILQCANRLRGLRPRFIAEQDYSRYSEEDLEWHLDRHRMNLLFAKVG